VRIFALLVATLFLVSCAPNKPESNQAGSIQLNSLTASLVARGFSPTIQPLYSASSYVPVTREWIKSIVYPKYISQLADVGLFKDGRPRYSSTSQCNFFADKLLTVSQECLFNDRFHSFDSTESPAIGVIWYLRNNDPKLAHAINIALLSDGSVVFFEPQAAIYSEIVLTQAEISSIWLVRF
jgi:hypothetical protein